MYIMKVEKLILSEQKTEQLSSPVSVGVHLHLFYPDLIPVFLEYLGRIPVPFSLFVSVPDGVVADDDDVEKSFRMLSNVQEIIIKHTPNRGRDIAPMLCGFADEFRKYEVMLHLHTKKSPHGKMQAGWLEHILEHLLPSPALIQTILIKLQRDAGMVVGETHQPLALDREKLTHGRLPADSGNGRGGDRIHRCSVLANADSLPVLLVVLLRVSGCVP